MGSRFFPSKISSFLEVSVWDHSNRRNSVFVIQQVICWSRSDAVSLHFHSCRCIVRKIADYYALFPQLAGREPVNKDSFPFRFIHSFAKSFCAHGPPLSMDDYVVLYVPN
ncbi:hypothetical protein SAY87_002716 [Trapa incisa]|uniref:Uncharacterized protein n=1 Tax=Trapa incisa TaxID=236973 RepID=A0AAN7JWJ6_9MYRT|nr:hypothetical protein SAY87_002716 [Trapa incisa]